MPRKLTTWPCFAILTFGVLLLVANAALADQPTRSAPGALAAISLKTDGIETPLGDTSLHPRLGWILAARDSSARGLRQTAFRVMVARSAEKLAHDTGDLWDSGRVAADDGREVEFAPDNLRSHSRFFWKVMVWDQDGNASPWSAAASWCTGLLHPGEWQAHWIAAAPAPVKSKATERGPMPPPLPILRGEFNLAKPVASAFVFVSGLGQYELHLNGRSVTQNVLTPGWTDYRKTILYNTYDVTPLLRTGKNAFGALLGNGMYNVEKGEGRYTKFVASMGQPQFILQLHVIFTDGSEATVISDKSWKTAPGPILFSSIYGGEDFDATRTQAGWDAADFDSSHWSSATEVQSPGSALTSQRLPSVAVARTYIPVSSKVLSPTKIVYDLGQNFSGWPVIEVRGSSGSMVKLLPGELLNNKGEVTQESGDARPGSEVSYTYTLAGQGSEQWKPRFSYTGFRYLQVETSAPLNAPAGKQPEVLSVRGEFLHDKVGITGTFETSDKLFQSIHRLINMAILSNMMSVLTDCPTREKLGWLEQTHLAATSIMYNYDVAQLYYKMSDDMRDSQLATGLTPSIAPEYVAFTDNKGVSNAFRDSPEWGSAIVLSPWAAYQFYGDKTILAAHYEEMHRYIKYLRSKSLNHLLNYGLGDWYDIGPAAPGESQLTSKSVTATAIYYQDLITLAKIARILDKSDQAREIEVEAAAVRDAFNQSLFHPETNQYDRGSQTANAIALVTGLVPQSHSPGVLENLVKDIRAHGNHVTAGDIGFHYVVRALTDSGRSDVLFDMLSRTDSPSYGYQVAKGATTLTEAWDTNPRSSQNHFMLGHAEEWFYRGLAGIDFDMSRPAPQRIILRPGIVGDVASASATFHSVLGTITSGWRRTGGVLTLEIEIPPGATALLYLPASGAQAIVENGNPIDHAAGLSKISQDGNRTVLTASSGKYHFIIK